MTSSRTTTTRFLALLFALAMLGSACGSTEGVSAESASQDDATVVDDAPVDADVSSSDGDGSGVAGCRLLSDAFIQDLFGEVVAPDDGLADELDTLEDSECTWTATADDDAETDFYYISVSLYPAGHMANYPAEWDFTPVDGVGDEAFVDLVGGLSFREGDREFGIFIRKSWDAEVNDADELEVMTAAAAEVLANS